MGVEVDSSVLSDFLTEVVSRRFWYGFDMVVVCGLAGYCYSVLRCSVAVFWWLVVNLVQRVKVLAPTRRYAGGSVPY